MNVYSDIKLSRIRVILKHIDVSEADREYLENILAKELLTAFYKGRNSLSVLNYTEEDVLKW